MNPLAQLAADRERARAEGDPMADLCVFGTVDAAGDACLRTLVLRDLRHENEARVAVFVNATSPKWLELAGKETATVLVYLPSAGIQYRLRARLEPVPDHVVHEQWRKRPRTPKHLDWIYTRCRPQSAPLAGPAEAAALLAEVAAEVGEDPVAPGTAKGLFLAPERIERLVLTTGDAPHDRRLYRPRGADWTETHLLP